LRRVNDQESQGQQQSGQARSVQRLQEGQHPRIDLGWPLLLRPMSAQHDRVAKLGYKLLECRQQLSHSTKGHHEVAIARHSIRDRKRGVMHHLRGSKTPAPGALRQGIHVFGPVVQRRGIEVRAVGPHQSVNLGIDLDCVK
jgi:hypothetical protein